jgi:hypothetical protein
MSLNDPNVDVTETYGDGMGKSGNGAEQTDIANRSLNYKGRFAPPYIDQKKEAERQREIDIVRG